jgi:hypothetical protein
MRALVVYESMYGNTHEIANQIAVGLESAGEVQVLSVADATEELVSWADLLVVGGPTHAHGLTSQSTRRSARDAAAKPDSDLTLDAEATGEGVRDWLRASVSGEGKRAAAFDTRIDAPALLTGRASHAIARRLRKHDFQVVAESASFLVDKHNRLVPGESERAVEWGSTLASA